MSFLVFVLFTLLTYTFAAEDLKQNDTSTTNLKQRASRQYNSNFYPENFVDDDDNSEDTNRYDRQKFSRTPTDEQNYYKQKRYEPYPGYGYAAVPNFDNAQKYYGNPSWKNFPSFEADQTGQVLFMDKQESSGDKGFFSSLTSDPQVATAIAAIIPLTIILFAVLPVLLSYFQQAGAGNILIPTFSPVTTIADSRLGRALTDREYLESTLQDIMEFAERALAEDRCVQQTVCQQVIDKAGDRNAKAVATAVGYLGKEDWLQNVGAGGLVKALKSGNCESVCDAPKKLRIRKRNIV